MKPYYDPYDVGRKLYRDGRGISDIWSAVQKDEDLDEAFRGYKSEQKTAELLETISDYLYAGGLFNPELMNHEKVRDLLIDLKEVLNERH